VTGSSRITYTETLFKRDSDNSLKPFKKILRSGCGFTERCETLGLSKVPGRIQERWSLLTIFVRRAAVRQGRILPESE
jgi:hypothetical protein